MALAALLDELEQWVDESIRQCRRCDPPYTPSRFMQMRKRLQTEYGGAMGTVEAINRLMRNSEPQSGFTRMVESDLEKWTLEWAVTSEQFRSLFPDKLVQAKAQARLGGKLNA